MDILTDFFARFGAHVLHVFSKPLDPTQRIYLLYLATSLIFAYAVYRMALRSRRASGGFLAFLFPKKVWSHPSAWLDLRYFFFHMFLGHFLLLGVMAGATYLVFGWVSDISLLESLKVETSFGAWTHLGAALAFMMLSALVADFAGFFMHYLQHKIPILWEFHKVHHSAEVMHPISNFREHPIDNAAYYLAIGGCNGLLIALALKWFGYYPSVPTVLGVPLAMFLFNVCGYNLRHSHIWLRWPGVWSMIFPSPAHHHIHHSCHPDHIDKNFAFMFPIWDVLFRTYHMPEDDRDVTFGIDDGDARDYSSCLRLYFIPFRNAYRLLRFGRIDAPEPEVQTSGEAAPKP